MKRYGQSAAEFLMTYGWAILLMLVIGVIAYQLGLFKLAGSVEPGASGFWGLTPTDSKFSSGTRTLEVSLTNFAGAAVEVEDNSYAKTASGSEHAIIIGDSRIDAGASETFAFDFNPDEVGSSGGRFDVLLAINYTDNRTEKSHLSSGRLWGTYEP